MRHQGLGVAGKHGPRASNSFPLALSKIVVYFLKDEKVPLRSFTSLVFSPVYTVESLG